MLNSDYYNNNFTDNFSKIEDLKQNKKPMEKFLNLFIIAETIKSRK